MEEMKELLEQFKYYANNPRKQLDKYLAEGKKEFSHIMLLKKLYMQPE